MSKLKDKLSANMRTVKANQQPAAAATKTQDKPIAKTADKAPAPKKPAPRAAAGKTPGDVPESGTALFPTRVWPD